MLPNKAKTPWHKLVDKKQQQLKALIPAEYLLPNSPSTEASSTNVLSLVANSVSYYERQITELPLHSLLNALCQGQLTSQEVLAAFSHRAVIAHQLTSCLSEIHYLAAQRRAQELDAYWRCHRSPIGPLHGLPVSLMDRFHVAQLDSACGFASWTGNARSESDEGALVASLRRLGAVIYCKTAVPMSMMMGETANNLTGNTTNPYNVRLSAGGACGGEGALIACHGSPLGICTDVAGYVRRSERLKQLYQLSNGPTSKRFQEHLRSPDSDSFYKGRNDKRRLEGKDNLEEPEADRPPIKRSRTEVSIGREDPIQQWVENDFEWSGVLGEAASMGSRKRLLSPADTQSYTWSSQSGNKPKAWTAKHKEDMLNAGIYLEERANIVFADDCKPLCARVLQAHHQLPEDWSFRGDNFRTILDLVDTKNESRVVRDVQPHLIPSPELLRAHGRSGLENIVEGLSADWTKCTSPWGPTPRPDVSHGISRYAFTSEERSKLMSYETCACEAMIFPFYICEAKCSDKAMGEAELQATHNTCVAMKAVIELYQAISAADELHGQILAFSMAHDHRTVKIFAHFPRIVGSTITYHRYRLFETDLVGDTANWTKPWQISLGILTEFGPIHHRRIQEGLSRQRGRAMESFTAQIDLTDSSHRGRSSPSSQEESQSKRVSLSFTSRVQEENENLKDQLAALLHELGQEKQESRKRQEKLDAQFAQQRDDARAQQEKMERRLQEQREESRKQREESRKQQEESRKHQEKLEARLLEQRDESRKQQEKLEARLLEERDESRKQQEKLEARLQEQQEELLSLLRQSMSSSQSEQRATS